MTGGSRKPGWIRSQLAGGDRRSLGRVDEVIAAVSRDETLFPALIAAMDDADSLVAMRACDAVVKSTQGDRSRLAHLTRLVLDQLAERPEAEVRWHVAQIIPHLSLDRRQHAQALRVLRAFLHDRSSIVRTFAMQALWDMGRGDAALHAEARDIVEEALTNGPPAVRARARRLLRRKRGKE